VGRTPKPIRVAVELGTRVRDLRHAKAWSIERLADTAGLHWTYVGSVERGERNVSLVNICRLARALGVGAEELTAGLQEHV